MSSHDPPRSSFNIDFDHFHEDNIRDNVSDFSEEESYDLLDGGDEANSIHINEAATQTSFFTNFNMHAMHEPVDHYGIRRGNNEAMNNDLLVGIQFESKHEAVNFIKQYHIRNSVDYVVEESRPDRFVARCKKFNDGCQWRIRASFSKRRGKWEITKLSGQHTCMSLMISRDHRRLDSTTISSCIIELVNANPNIPIKALIADVQSRFGYTVTYKKAWKAKQIAVSQLFGDWEGSYNELQKWMSAVLEFVPGTIVRYHTSPCYLDGTEDPNRMVLDRVFWAFKPCIEGFAYCKPIIQIDGTFLTGKYRGTLLVAVAQDGDRTTIPIAFAIVEGETKEAWAWFLHHLRVYVTPQPNICIISDRGKGILAALKEEQVGWVEPNAYSVYCVRHIASNFNRAFKDVELKK